MSIGMFNKVAPRGAQMVSEMAIKMVIRIPIAEDSTGTPFSQPARHLTVASRRTPSAQGQAGRGRSTHQVGTGRDRLGQVGTGT